MLLCRLKFFVRAFIACSFILVLILCINTYIFKDSKYRYIMLDNYVAQSEKVEKSKVVLFWTKYFDIEYWGMDAETYYEEFLKEINCPQTNCIFTHNKHFLSHPEQYDAIIFHGAERWFKVDLPRTRSSNQLYIVATKESPSEIKHNLDMDQDFYNLTMTYRLDSDINWNYGYTVDLSSGIKIAPALNVHWKEPDDDFNDHKIMEIVMKKQKTAAWFASHCNVFSKRDDLVKKIQKLKINVDVYGKCGSLICKPLSAECNEMLNTTYRFYFALENTLCIDYLTEKLYNTINHFIIPVIYSGADIARFLPPKSYIDVNDFETAEDLAKYLMFLEHQPNAYIKYFWWRKHYKVISSGEIQFCELCEKLNQPNLIAKRQTYTSIKDWFYSNVCSHPKIKF